MRLNYQKQDVAHAIVTKLRASPRTSGENNVWYVLDGIKVLRVTYPHGRGDLKKGTINGIINQLKLNKAQFKDLIDCPLSAQDYEQIIRALNLL